MRIVSLCFLVLMGCSFDDHGRKEYSDPVVISTIGDCKIYRIDHGTYYPIYTTICKDRATTEYVVPAGKITRPEKVETHNGLGYFP